MPKKPKPNPQETIIDAEQLIKILRLKPTLSDVASFFDCSNKAIERHIRKYHDMTFIQYRNRQMSHTKNALVQEALKQAKSGNTAMLIFSLKNLCDWTDKREVTGEVTVNSITDLLMSADQDVLDVTPKTIEGEVERSSDDESS